MKYPISKKVAVSDLFYGHSVADPYRWLEDSSSEETRQWIKEQNETTFTYLESLPNREKIRQRLTSLWDYERMDTPFYLSGKWLVFKNDGLQPQSVLYAFQNPGDEPKKILNPNELSTDGTVSLNGVDLSEDGRYLVYKVAHSGSDWNEIFILDIETGILLKDKLEWIKFSEITCWKDGFFYSAYQKPDEGKKYQQSNFGQKIFFHRFGTLQEEDELIFENPLHPNRMHTAITDHTGKWLFVVESESTSGNGLWIKNLSIKGSTFICIANGFDFEYNIIAVISDQLLLHTNDNAPKFRVVKTDLNSPHKENWIEVVPESGNTLVSCNYCGGKLFAHYMVDAKSALKVFKPDGNFIKDIQLPPICSIDKVSGNANVTEAFFSYSSFNTPSVVAKIYTETIENETFFQPKLSFDPNNFHVDQKFCTSNDGTNIPFFLFYRKGLDLSKPNPAMLLGYGGFSISLTPSFSPANLFYAESGGIYVLANLRGGGEYGEEWHKAGTKLKKQNVFDDFVSVAKYLINERYTTSEQLTIRGGSNGGLLVGAAINQHPELFKVALPAVGVMDMLRFHRFTIGYAWVSDYGSVDDNEEMFRYLLSYSPYHNVTEQAYPAIMATTADHDDRVVPAHTFKFISHIQEKNRGGQPALVCITTNAGHGSGKPTHVFIEEFTNIYAFVFYQTEMKPEF